MPKKQKWTRTQTELLGRIETGAAQSITGLFEVETSDDLIALWADDKGPIEVLDKIEPGRLFARPRIKPNGADTHMNTTMETPTTQAESPSGVGLPFDLDGLGQNLPTFFKQLKPARKPEYYPFSRLENPGDSFLVPSSDKYPEPWKTLRSAVNSANKRYSRETDQERKSSKTGKIKKVLAYDRKFEIRKVHQGDTYENGFVERATGARVYRSI